MANLVERAPRDDQHSSLIRVVPATGGVVPGPDGGDILVVTQFLFSEAAAPGEAGSLICYRGLRFPT
jgi:hypothetical protein